MAQKRGALGVLFFLVVLNSELIFLTGWKRSGFVYAREAFFLLCLCFTIVYLVDRLLKGKNLPRTQFLLLVFVCIGVLSPTINALIAYGQPLIYGVLEERRLLSYLALIPIGYFVARSKCSIKSLELMLYTAGFLLVFTSFLYAFGILPENARPDFMVEERNYGSNDPRYATRFPINTNYIFLIYCLALTNYFASKTPDLRATTYIAAALIYILAIDQGRTNILMFLFATALSILKSPNKRKAFILISAVVVFAMPTLYSSLENLDTTKLEFMFSQASIPLEEQVRFNTVSIILSNLSDSYYAGWGALSLQWQEGFHRYYGPNFYLSDVALFGTLYRHGWLFPIYLSIFIWMLHLSFKDIPKGSIKDGIRLVFISFALFGFFNGKIEYAGSTFVVIMAIGTRTSILFRSSTKCL